jgi:hypothetical protein
MKLKQQIASTRDLQCNSRIVIEKVKDVSFGKKFKKIINKNKIGHSLFLSSDLQACIHLLVECYLCYISIEKESSAIVAKRLNSLIKSLLIINNQIDVCINFNKPLDKRYIASALRAHTRLFKVTPRSSSPKECDKLWQKFILSSITVWSNNWNA